MKERIEKLIAEYESKIRFKKFCIDSPDKIGTGSNFHKNFLKQQKQINESILFEYTRFKSDLESLLDHI